MTHLLQGLGVQDIVDLLLIQLSLAASPLLLDNDEASLTPSLVNLQLRANFDARHFLDLGQASHYLVVILQSSVSQVNDQGLHVL